MIARFAASVASGLMVMRRGALRPSLRRRIPLWVNASKILEKSRPAKSRYLVQRPLLEHAARRVVDVVLDQEHLWIVTPPSMKWLESKKPFKPMLAERIPNATKVASRATARIFIALPGGPSSCLGTLGLAQ